MDEAVRFLVGLIDELREWIDDPKRTKLGLKARFGTRKAGLNLDNSGYLVADGGRLILMRIRSRLDIADDKYAIPIRATIERVMGSVIPDDIYWGITGVPVMVAEERSGLKRDLQVTGTVSFVGCLLIFLIAYRSLRGTMVVFLPLAAGIAWALALAALLIGSLNIISSSFAVILIGMGIDFSVHLFTRVRDERKDGTDGPEGARRALIGTGPAILTGALTSAAAFGAMGLTGFRATRELGIIAGTGLLMVMIAAFILVPLVLGRKGAIVGRPTSDRLSGPRKFVWPRAATMPVIVGGLLVTLGLGSTIRPIDFNFDWTSYLPQDSMPIRTIEVLQEHGVSGLQYAVTQSRSLEEARAQYDRLVALSKDPDSVVDRVESIFDVLPPQLARKEPVVAEIRRRATALPRIGFEGDPAAPTDKLAENIAGLSERLSEDLPFTLREAGQGDLVDKLGPVVEAVDRLHASVKERTPQELRARLDRFETRFADISKRFGGFLNRKSAPLRPDDLPRSLVSPFYQPQTEDGPMYAIRVYARGNVDDDPAVARRLKETLREIDPDATGYAITQIHFGVLMKDSLSQSALWAGMLVLFLVLLDLRRPRDVALALVPLGMGGVWMIGLMNVFGVEYTFANVLSIPLIIGIGIDSGIHVIHRWRECEDVGMALITTGKAILVSSLTTMMAFGSLMLATNGGGRTLGMTLVLGVGACMVTSLVFLPALLDAVGRRAEVAGS